MKLVRFAGVVLVFWIGFVVVFEMRLRKAPAALSPAVAQVAEVTSVKGVDPVVLEWPKFRDRWNMEDQEFHILSGNGSDTDSVVTSTTRCCLVPKTAGQSTIEGAVDIRFADVVLSPPHWGIFVYGTIAGVDTCSRCGRLLDRDATTHLSNALRLTNDDALVFFDGCMKCLEADLAAVASGSKR